MGFFPGTVVGFSRVSPADTCYDRHVILTDDSPRRLFPKFRPQAYDVSNTSIIDMNVPSSDPRHRIWLLALTIAPLLIRHDESLKAERVVPEPMGSGQRLSNVSLSFSDPQTNASPVDAAPTDVLSPHLLS